MNCHKENQENRDGTVENQTHHTLMRLSFSSCFNAL